MMMPVSILSDLKMVCDLCHLNQIVSQLLVDHYAVSQLLVSIIVELEAVAEVSGLGPLPFGFLDTCDVDVTLLEVSTSS